MAVRRCALAVALCITALRGPFPTDGYPEMAGSCGMPVGSHLPNKAEDGSGGFEVTLEPKAGGSAATVRLSHSEGPRKLKGFMLRAVDAETLEEAGTFSSLPPNTMLYEGCRRKAAAVCQLTDNPHHGGEPVQLPATLQLTWPPGKHVRVLFWPVEGHHNFYFNQASSDASLSSAVQTDPRLRSAGCTHGALAMQPMLIALGVVPLVCVFGALPRIRFAQGLRKQIAPYRHIVNILQADYGVGGWSCGRSLAVAVWIGSQLAALVSAMQLIPGFPMQATIARGLGTLAAAGLCVVLLPVSRTSAWPRFLGVPYERAVIWHRQLGVWTLVATGVHGGIMISDYDIPEIFSTTESCFGLGNLWGTLSGFCMAILLILSMGPVRRKAYRIFHMAHIVLVPLIIVAACLHITDLVYWILPAVCVELAYNVIGRVKTDRVELLSSQIYSGNIVELRLQAPHVCAKLAKKQRQSNTTGPACVLGNWVYVSVLDAGLGEILNPHPFSIAEIGPGQDEIRLLIKATSTTSTKWTSSLLAHVTQQNTDPQADDQDALLTKPWGLRVEGPYGSPSLPLHLCSTLVCIAGGIGVTPLLPILSMCGDDSHSATSSLLQRTNCLPELKRLVFIWVVRYKSDFDCASRLLASAAQIPAGACPSVDIHLFCTQGSDTAAGDIPVASGRPDFDKLMRQSAADTPGAGHAMAFVCGPSAMIDNVRTVGEKLDMPVHEETFSM